MYMNYDHPDEQELAGLLPGELAEAVITRRRARLLELEEEALSLIGAGGYVSPEADALADAALALALGKNVLLQGPTGSGKTKLAESLSRLFGQPLHAVNCSVDLDAEGLVGFKTLALREGKSVIDFIPGPIVNAMKRGHWLYIDEVNMAKPETPPLINGVLDHRRTITNPFTGEVVRAAEGFGVIAAVNIGYVGTVPMNEALKNRFVVVEVPYLEGARLRQLLYDQSRLKDGEQLDRFVRLSADLQEQIRSGPLAEEAGSIRAPLDACDLAAFMEPLRAVRRAIADKLEDERERALVTHLAETLF
ncbi:MoxR family ATPase [Paenibacillus sp. P25]|nr:MoxR family ATPase [Paenibacillus sp. P25]